MTDLNLICEEPYKIGLIGSISFISFSLGSLFTSKLADTYGRRRVVIGATLVTPLGLLILLLAPVNLMVINVLMFVIGFTYNARSTGAYLFNTEFIESEKRINIGICLWTFSGAMQGLSAFWFWYTKDQEAYLKLIIVLLFVAILIIYLFVPESPLYLYEKHMFKELGKSLLTIGSINRIDNLLPKVRYAVIRLKIK